MTLVLAITTFVAVIGWVDALVHWKREVRSLTAAWRADVRRWMT
jgi:UDP-N-acetylmuramyl pentapeptide phosphotransferase/UDP-N-acetylglucosamine-1-phosphate transferase